MESAFTFRMGDHEVTMRETFSQMYDSRQLCDCALVCMSMDPNGQLMDNRNNTNDDEHIVNGHSSSSSSVQQNRTRKSITTSGGSGNNDNVKVIKAHRVVLSASSDYFRNMFASLCSTNCGTQLTSGIIAVVINHADPEDIESIIEFIYKGQVSVGQSRIQKFLATAQSLAVKGLMNIKLVTHDGKTPLNKESPSGGNNSNDNDDNDNAEEIEKLKLEKRHLELELERMKKVADNDRHKIDMEKKVLSEAKKKFEAECQKTKYEKMRLEALLAEERAKNSKGNNENDGLWSPKVRSQSLDEDGDDDADAAVKDTEKTLSSPKPEVTIISDNTSSAVATAVISTVTFKSIDSKDGSKTISQTSQSNTTVIASPTPTAPLTRSQHAIRAQTSTSTPLSQKTSSIGSESDDSPQKRLLRKRPLINTNVKPENSKIQQQQNSTVNTNNYTKINNNNNNNSNADISMATIDEDDDGEIFEVDFSQLGKDRTNTEEPSVSSATNVGEARHRLSVALTGSAIQSAASRAIVASTLAAMNNNNNNNPSTSSAAPVRTLRRSTSSQGSGAQTNIGDDSIVTANGDQIVLRRKGPGRTPWWMKEKEGKRLSDHNNTPDKECNELSFNELDSAADLNGHSSELSEITALPTDEKQKRLLRKCQRETGKLKNEK